MNAADWIRHVAIVEGAIVCGFAVAIIFEARRFRKPPVYVETVAASYVLLNIYAIVSTYERIGASVGLWLILALAAFTFGLVAMVAMFCYYLPGKRRIRHARVSEEAAKRYLAEHKLRVEREAE